MIDYLYNLATDKPRPFCSKSMLQSKKERGKHKSFMASLIKIFLFIISLIYGMMVNILILFYRLKPYRLNCKVISIGNITLGGTGKTSLVEYVARYLKSQGHKVAILSRGYKRRITQYAIRNTQYETMGDEPYMLSKKLGDIPILVDANRIRAANRAIKDYRVDTVILDDGFQQWRLVKDLEIVTIDATDPFGNRYLLPRGILREPLSSLTRVDAIVLTKTNLNPDTQDIKDFLSQINPAAQIMESIHKPLGFYKMDKPDELLSIDTLKAKTFTLVSGIGDPDSFENLITSLGINIGLVFRFRDHHDYTKEDLDKIIKGSQAKNIDTIITTEKDVARLHSLQFTMFISLQFFVLRIELKITKNEEGFHSRLLRLYSH